jgi:hypothetical protein
MHRLTVLALAAALPLCGAEKGKWVSLFDGKTLKGWAVHSGTASYKAEKGAILGTAVLGSPNSFLCTEKEYGDFILEFEVLVDNELNSGVQVRSQFAKEALVFKLEDQGKTIQRKIPADRVYGYQVEIAAGARGASGNVYDEARRARFLDDFSNKPAARAAFQNSQWNKYRIVCQGDSLRTWVNGVPAADIKDSLTARGIIGLQVHQIPKDKFKPYQVRFRKLRIKELP